MLLQTKLSPPPLRPETILRTRLQKKLARGVGRKLILVSAPAGYGKTTLVANWLTQQNKQRQAQAGSAWLSLDEADNDPARFLRYFAAALAATDPQIGKSLEEMLQSSQPGSLQQSPEATLTALINDLHALGTPCCIVLDDYHLIENKSINQALQFWLKHAPPHVTTIIISRSKPSIGLSRLRARGRLVELHSADLQFTAEESAEFLQKTMRLSLSTESITQLAQRTEGWIASLQLAALALQANADPESYVSQFAGTDRYLVDYLLEEVFDQQSADLQSFLLATSVLSRFNHVACQIVAERDDSQQILQVLDEKNLFVIALDTQREWYRYHPLFADFLQQRLAQQDNARRPLLLQKAFQWFKEQGLVDEAVRYALSGEQFVAAADLLTEHATSLIWVQSRPSSFVSWCENLPESVLYERPRLVIMLAWAFVFLGRFDAAVANVEKFHTDEYGSGVDDNISGQFATLRGEIMLHEGKVAESLTWFERAQVLISAETPNQRAAARQAEGFARRLNGDLALAEAVLTESISLARSLNNRALDLFATNDLAQTYLAWGKLKRAASLYESLIDSFPQAMRSSYLPLKLTYVGLAQVHLQSNRLIEAQQAAELGVAFDKHLNAMSPSARLGQFVLADVLRAQGAWKRAEKLLVLVNESAQRSQNARYVDQFATQTVRQYLLQGDVDSADYWLAQAVWPHADAPRPVYQQQQRAVVAARLLWAQGDAKQATSQLKKLAASADAAQWRQSRLEIALMQALIAQSQNRNDSALRQLQVALAIAEPQGYVRPFVDEGVAMARLLQAALERGVSAEFIGQLQSAFLPAVASQPLTDALTRRELEILGRIAEGQSNREIADALIVAIGTVAKHTNNIFGKLGVRNRTEATNRARALNILT